MSVRSRKQKLPESDEDVEVIWDSKSQKPRPLFSSLLKPFIPNISKQSKSKKGETQVQSIPFTSQKLQPETAEKIDIVGEYLNIKPPEPPSLKFFTKNSKQSKKGQNQVLSQGHPFASNKLQPPESTEQMDSTINWNMNFKDERPTFRSFAPNDSQQLRKCQSQGHPFQSQKLEPEPEVIDLSEYWDLKNKETSTLKTFTPGNSTQEDTRLNLNLKEDQYQSHPFMSKKLQPQCGYMDVEVMKQLPPISIPLTTFTPSPSNSNSNSKGQSQVHRFMSPAEDIANHTKLEVMNAQSQSSGGCVYVSPSEPQPQGEISERFPAIFNLLTSPPIGQSDQNAQDQPEVINLEPSPPVKPLKKARKKRKTVQRHGSILSNLSGGRRSASVGTLPAIPEVLSDEDDESDEEIRQCLALECINAARKGSKYCSTECCVQLASDRIHAILPGRIEEWLHTPSVAEERNKAELEELLNHQENIKLKIQELEKELTELNEYVDSVKDMKVGLPSSLEIDDASQSSATSAEDEGTVDCVVCGINLNVKSFLKHTERCFNKQERLKHSGCYQRSKIDGIPLMCDAFNRKDGTYCKRLKVLCDKHHKDPKILNGQICGCPLIETSGKPTGEMCRILKTKCYKHYVWEKYKKGAIEIQRYNCWIKLEELMIKERFVRNAMFHRGNLLNLLMNSTTPAGFVSNAVAYDPCSISVPIPDQPLAFFGSDFNNFSSTIGVSRL